MRVIAAIMKHRGHMVEKVVRQSGYSITRLAKKLGMSRNTLYNRFSNPNIGYRFIMDVGNVIHYDFGIDFPEIKAEIEIAGEAVTSTMDRGTAELLRVDRKYIRLLEKYQKLLEILVKLANVNELHTLKKEILEFIEGDEESAPPAYRS